MEKGLFLTNLEVAYVHSAMAFAQYSRAFGLPKNEQEVMTKIENYMYEVIKEGQEMENGK